MDYPVTFSTERIHIRPLIMSDKDWWNAYFESEKCMKYMPKSLLQNEDPSRTWIEKQLNRYKDGEFGLELITDIQTGDKVGQCGLMTQSVDNEIHLEVGYHLIDKYWKKGYASHAAKCFRDLAFKHFNAKELISIIHVQNQPSQNVAMSNGMTLWKETKFKQIDVLIYRIKKSTWLNLS